MSTVSIGSETNLLRDLNDIQRELAVKLQGLSFITQEQIDVIRRREDSEARRELERSHRSDEFQRSLDRLRESIGILAAKIETSARGPSA